MRLILGWLLALTAFQDTKVQEDLADVLPRISEEKIREHAVYLASDELEGRLSGHPGNVKAAEYIAKKLKEFGYAPLGDAGDYLQKFKVDPNGEITTANVVGFLRGTDEKLSKECVVIGAHFDHVGKADQKLGSKARRGGPTDVDKIWNGADDNASGSSTVLEVARIFSTLKTRRSVIFIWFSGEELGLLGSRHFVKNPPADFPKASMAAMINLDMVGRNANRPCSILGLGSEKGELFESIVKQAVELGKLDARLLQDAVSSGGDSDHSSFRREGIPVMFFFTGGHPDYHTVSDHADKLNYDNMAKVGRTALAIVHALANSADRPAFDPDSNKSHGSGSVTMKYKLGVMPSYAGVDDAALDKLGLGKDEGVLPIESVNAGSVAEKSGLKAGDMIAAIAGEKLPRKEPIQRYMEILGTKIKAFEPVEIVVFRKGEKVVVQAAWGGRLGVQIDKDALDEDAYAKLGLGKEEGGLFVKKVEDEGVANKAGLKPGDVIVSINGEKLPRVDPMARLIDVLDTKIKPNEAVPIEILRKDARATLQVKWETAGR